MPKNNPKFGLLLELNTTPRTLKIAQHGHSDWSNLVT